jgi:hypothetical protein
MGATAAGYQDFNLIIIIINLIIILNLDPSKNQQALHGCHSSGV